jgi:ribose 5-phosphate isomerase B
MAGTIVVGCDNAAVALKNEVVKHLAAGGWEVSDLGVDSDGDQTPYPDVAARVCGAVLEGAPDRRGILLCGTGIGMSITANKFRGIYATPIHDAYSAERACLSNDVNVATLGARVVGRELALKLLDQWLGLRYRSGRSDSKIARVKHYEDLNLR